MKLRALRLHGFKSFADRTEVEFHDGITAIVGPNGCGKSNISDAIRWVLGEQRPTAIRGAKMEEAIFQGTVSRRPVNRGSVSMEVSNEDGALPVPYSEVEITRTVYRDGGSDYLLNRSACRLRDIQDLCRDTGLGANAYSVIENRMIDAILSDRAEERRGLFEEAAGVGKYKDRRKEASRRLERAEVDLQRIQDLIGEVETKVRSLARQKGKAERYAELRKRRLDLEMAVVRTQLSEMGLRRKQIREALAGDAEKDEGLRAQLGTAESRVQTLRLEQVTREKERSAAAAEVERLRTAIVEWERRLAVASERIGYADRRLRQIEQERADAERDAADARASEEELAGARLTLEAAIADLGTTVEERSKALEAAREELDAVRSKVTVVEAEEAGVARRLAQLLGDAEAAGSRSQELEERIAYLASELEEGSAALKKATSQGDLFSGRLGGLEQELATAAEHLRAEGRRLDEARQALETARARERAAQDAVSALRARQSALAGMERDREGVGAAVQAVLGLGWDGVLGILADFVETSPSDTDTVEAVLGEMLRAIVVRDTEVAHRLARWFRNDWEGGGGVIVLPLDRVPVGRASGSLVNRVATEGDGGAWVRALLDGVETGADVGPDAGVMWVERDGIMHLGSPADSTGILERRALLAELEGEVEAAEGTASDALGSREEAEKAFDRIDAEVLAARERVREAEDAVREARAEEAERTSALGRMERLVVELEGQRAGAERALEAARERAVTAKREQDSLAQEESRLERHRTELRGEMEGAQQAFDEARAAAARLDIERARLEGDRGRLADRERDLERARTSAESRIAALAREEGELRSERESAEVEKSEGGEAIERLFEERQRAETALRERDEGFTGLQEELIEAERQVREARNQERAASEHRHALELEEQELRGRIGRIQDRLEGEWGRSLERLLEEAEDVDLDDADARRELEETRVRLERLGPVNMLAVEEHEEESARLSFLSEQRDDLVAARDDLRAAIREINETATDLFMQSFEAIRSNFRDTFLRLFEGGECDLWLADPDDPLESDIEIHAAPRGKRTQRIDLLSGGERALTALSLLFGIYLVKPSPFCVLDEVDAPLDESNIGRFIRLLQEFKARSQFVVITHNPRTIEAADWIYGVTMEEPGVSSIVGVRLEEALETVAP